MSTESTAYPLDNTQVIDLLRGKDISPTAQRVIIASYLFSRQQHLSAEQILEGVYARDESVSKATVYNTLGLFTRKGLVREVLIDPQRIFYDSNLSAHYHFYNLDTGTLEDIPSGRMRIDDLPEIPGGCTLDSLDIIVKIRNTR
jgi:Fur family iron response transcriptional regulator